MSDSTNKASFRPTSSELPAYFVDTQQRALTSYPELSLPVIERLDYSEWPLFDTRLASGEGSGGELSDATSERLVQQLAPELADQGVLVMDLFDAMVTYPDLVAAHLFSVIPPEDKVTAYHTAYLTGGVFVYVPAFVELKEAITVSLKQASREGQAFNQHVLIVAEAGSRFDYVESVETSSIDASSATIVVEVVAKAGAYVNYCSLDRLGAATTAYVKRATVVERDATVNWSLGMMSNGQVILDVDAYLNGSGASSQVTIAAVSSGSQVQVADTRIVNRGHYSKGAILQYGVILDEAVLTFNGTGLIEQQAKYADAQQESRLLMLSDQARGDANPILLIEEFEVTAGHAASVAQPDEEQLYYLMSRGIPRAEAEYLVTRGFLGPVLQQIRAPKTRALFEQAIDTKLASFVR